MSRIDELIARFCPDGVPTEPLSSIGTWYGGGTPSKAKAEYWDGGDIPWVSPKDMGRRVVDSAIDSITEIAVRESSTKLVPPTSVAMVVRSSILDRIFPSALVPVPVTLNQDMKAVVPREGILAEFVAHLLSSRGSDILRTCSKSGGSVTSINSPQLFAFRIPVPPLEVQREIVRILDQFTQLEAELEAELEARRRQYEYYRDSLVSKSRFLECEWVPLASITSIRTGSKPNSINGTGNVPYINAGNEPSGFTEAANTQSGVVTIPSRGQGSAGHVGFQNSEFWCGPLCYRVISTNSNISEKFLYYFLKNIQDELVSLRKIGSIPAVNKSDLGKVLVPVIAVDEQLHKVAALDYFDSLVNDFSVGLPAELTARRKQYEYYRDKLLAFEEVV